MVILIKSFHNTIRCIFILNSHILFSLSISTLMVNLRETIRRFMTDKESDLHSFCILVLQLTGIYKVLITSINSMLEKGQNLFKNFNC